MSNILVIKAHPRADSFCNALTDQYIKGAIFSGNKIEVLSLRELNLEIFIKFGHKEKPILPEDLLDAQKLIAWADVLVFSYPVWWSTPPALLKVFFEAVFISGFAYKYKKSLWNIPRLDRLLSGRSARIITTMDSPTWYYRIIKRDPGFKMMKNILDFCGIKPLYRNYFGSVFMSSDRRKEHWLKKAYKLGSKERV